MSASDQLAVSVNRALKGLNIDAQCVGARINRHMAFCDLKLAEGCKVRKIESSTPEIALAIGSRTEPIVKSIPQRGIVRLHVAMGDPQPLSIYSIYRWDESPSGALLPFLLGETDDGRRLWTDMSRNPHMLVAGGTGSGKSVLLHTMIRNVQALNARGTHNIRLSLIDPKSVEFLRYKDTPGVARIATSFSETIELLQWQESIMETRYKQFAIEGIQNVEELPVDYSKHVIIIDEAADLMMMDKRSHMFETLICRLAQKARAAGIYVIMATQRPSVDVITGLIKANFPARISCKVSSKTDSRVILDRCGAEMLVGRGDAIIHNSDNEWTRFQVCMGV